MQLYICHWEDLIDREKEIERPTKEQDRSPKEIARCDGMLSNPNFVKKHQLTKLMLKKAKLAKYKEMGKKK